MDFEALVKAITERVLAELCAAGYAPATPSGRRVLVLATPDAAERPPVEARLRERLGPGINLEFFQGAAAAQKADRYVMPSLCCPDMAALATGRATGPITRKTLDLLLAGEKVEVLAFEYTRHASTAPPALYSLYAGYEKSLAAFGLVRLEDAAPGRVKLRGGLVTEKSIKEAAGRGVKILSVPAGTIVTALAEDSAKEFGIEIAKDGEL